MHRSSRTCSATRIYGTYAFSRRPRASTQIDVQCFISNFISFAILSISQLSHHWTDWCESDNAGAHVMGEKPRWKITICHFERVSFDPTVLSFLFPLWVSVVELFATRYSPSSMQLSAKCSSHTHTHALEAWTRLRSFALAPNISAEVPTTSLATSSKCFGLWGAQCAYGKFSAIFHLRLCGLMLIVLIVFIVEYQVQKWRKWICFASSLAASFLAHWKQNNNNNDGQSVLSVLVIARDVHRYYALDV